MGEVVVVALVAAAEHAVEDAVGAVERAVETAAVDEEHESVIARQTWWEMKGG